jgi:hypothetical protein
MELMWKASVCPDWQLLQQPAKAPCHGSMSSIVPSIVAAVQKAFLSGAWLFTVESLDDTAVFFFSLDNDCLLIR